MTTQLTLDVEGMTCQHCVNAVTVGVSALTGVDEVSIDVVPQGRSTLRVSANQEISRDDVAQAVVAAGYSVVDS